MPPDATVRVTTRKRRAGAAVALDGRDRGTVANARGLSTTWASTRAVARPCGRRTEHDAGRRQAVEGARDERQRVAHVLLGGLEIGRTGETGGRRRDQALERCAEQDDEAGADATHGDRRGAVGEARQRAAVLDASRWWRRTGSRASRPGRRRRRGRQAVARRGAGSLTRRRAPRPGPRRRRSTTTPPPFANAWRRALSSPLTEPDHTTSGCARAASAVGAPSRARLRRSATPAPARRCRRPRRTRRRPTCRRSGRRERPGRGPARRRQGRTGSSARRARRRRRRARAVVEARVARSRAGPRRPSAQCRRR